MFASNSDKAIMKSWSIYTRLVKSFAYAEQFLKVYMLETSAPMFLVTDLTLI